MALIAHQTPGSYASFPSRSKLWTKEVKLKPFVSLQLVGKLDRSLSSRRFCLRPTTFLPAKVKQLKVSAFKGTAQNDESGGRSNGSKISKNSVKLSYVSHDEETIAESPDTQKEPLSYSSAGEENIAGSPAIQKLFKKWLMMLRTQSSNQVVDGIFGEGPVQSEAVECDNGSKKQEKAKILKAAWCYFLELDATIKIPPLIFIPWYLAVNVVYGAEVSKELTPLWIFGPVIVALYIKMLQGLCALYVFTFRQTETPREKKETVGGVGCGEVPGFCGVHMAILLQNDQGSFPKGLFGRHHSRILKMNNLKGNSSQFLYGIVKAKRIYPKRQPYLFATTEEHSSDNGLTSDASEQDKEYEYIEGLSQESDLPITFGGSSGRPGFISFYGRSNEKQVETLVPSPVKNQSNLIWFVGPSVLVASFIFPSLYLRKVLSSVFEDSLLTDFLILFFTEALFYLGVAVFLLLTDRLQRPSEQISSPISSMSRTTQLLHRISSVATLVLSLIIPLVTMGLVWPWTGPAASATLAPYLVGIIMQFTFEQYAKYVKSPSWPVVPIIFQVYRLHQLNRAAQLVTALSFTVRGAEATSHNMAINSSLGTLLNVLQFLGIICIWSLASFLMRLVPYVEIST
ncbi:embryo defective [Thalictrum thalictroides]|uniref:Embryo defective n=1 Tax=Thalictrum thalictroides TaxID=46969 RepID=A0A7J6V3B5_THATH|nr:embryo defective [Thalictrum thalictroides]